MGRCHRYATIASVSHFRREVQRQAGRAAAAGPVCLARDEWLWYRPVVEAGHLVSDIFREIDEELRRDNFAKLWQRYGAYVIGAAVAAVLATAAVVGWQEYQARQRQAEGMHYAAALDLARQGKDKAAADVFAELGRAAHPGRAVLARLEDAALRARSGDVDAAIKLYDGIARDGSVEATYRDVATLLAARYGLEKDDTKATVERLAPLTDPANPWHASALELTALAQLKAGEKVAARASYAKLADDLTAPQGLRARAAEMVAALPANQ